MNLEVELIKKLKELKKVAICYSGGIDSAYLLTIANNVLNKNNVIALIAKGPMVDQNDYFEALNYLNMANYNYYELDFNPLEISEFRNNTKDRCYYCKYQMLSILKNKANSLGFKYLLDGQNKDDLGKYRPGSKASKELDVLSPLSNMTKLEIRTNAKKLNISFYDKPANSCLATRFPYNTFLTSEKLKLVEKAEHLLKTLGLKLVRTRIHDEILRIEVLPTDFNLIINSNIATKIKELGFKYITLDLLGYSSGNYDIKI